MALRLSAAVACLLVLSLSVPAQGARHRNRTPHARTAKVAQLTRKPAAAKQSWIAGFRTRAFERAKRIAFGAPKPERLDGTEFTALGGRSLDRYFPGKGTPDLEALDKDVRLYLYNFGLVHTGKPEGLREHKQLIAEWEQVKTGLEHVRPADLSKSLRDFVLDMHVKVVKPQKRDTVRMRVRKALIATALFPVRLTLKAGRGLMGFLGSSMKITFAVTLGAAVLGFVLNPIANNITAKLNENVGWVSVGVQGQITRLEQWWAGQDQSEAVAGLQNAESELAEIHRKYRIGGLTRAEAFKLWTDVEEVSQRYGIEVSAVLPMNIQDGRFYYREGNIVFPVYFATAASSVNNERMIQELRLENLNARIGAREPTVAEASERAELEQGIKNSRQRMGSILAMWRVNEIFFPEYNRANFMEKNPDLKPLMKSYETFKEGLNFDDYAGAYLEEYGKQLDALGIPRGAGLASP